MKVEYAHYINSDEWRSKHPDWLKQSHHTCAMLPWLYVGRVKGKHYRYSIHHLSYRNLGHEKLWRDVVPLSRFAHDRVIHGILSGFKRPSQQRHYPNKVQQLAHGWCCLPLGVKWIVIWAIVLLLGVAVLN